MSSWHSYPSIYNCGHKALAGYFDGPVIVQEKVDGSQFSFGVIGDEQELKVRSKGATIYPDNPPKMFARAVQTVQGLQDKLRLGWTYRGEVLDKPKHNTLAYDRVPAQHIILFDINDGEESYLPYEQVVSEGQRLGLEVVPTLYSGKVENLEQFEALLDTVSVLGGQKIEGVVAKRYDLFGPDKKVLLAKYVREEFKELNSKSFRADNPTRGDVMQRLIAMYKNESRWAKAVQHLRDAGALQNDPKDIGALMKEAQADIEKECADEIRDALMAWALPQIKRGAVAGLPQWYKEKLLASQFAQA